MKLKLEMENATGDFFEGIHLLGLVAPIPDYQFCWQLNQILGFDFRVKNEYEIQLRKKQRNYFFNVFAYSEPVSSLEHYLYNNQFDGEYLLPEFRHLDFLWLLKGDEVSAGALQDLIQTIRNINGVQLVLQLSPEKIKNKEHLLF